MHKLRDIQEKLQAYIINNDAQALDCVVNSENAPSKDRLEIYREAYYLRLLEVLEKDFPCLKIMLGNELFNKLGYKYIDSYPSNQFSVCQFSRHYAEFLINEGCEPYYIETAIFEWAITRTLDAADVTQITFNDLLKIEPDSWPHLQFSLHPSVQFFQFKYNIPQRCLEIMFEREPPALFCMEKPEYWVIWRFDYNSFFESLSDERVFMLNAIKQNKNFAEICEGLAEFLSEEEAAQFAAVTLRFFIDKCIISDANLPSQNKHQPESKQEIFA